LETIVRLAPGSAEQQTRASAPSTILLSNRLMWSILNFDSGTETIYDATMDSLFDSSLRPNTRSGTNSPALQIPVSTPPEVTVNTFDGGQAPRTGSGTTYPSASVGVPGAWSPPAPARSSENSLNNDISWLWAEQGPNLQLENLSRSLIDPHLGDPGESSWWEFGNL
jgi:hypothetical protein